MILNPAIIALLSGSVMVSGFALYAAAAGYDILRHWDPDSGSARQLKMERRTYLISTILMYTFGFELLSLFLFVFTADNLHGQFVGAMCAAGSLNVNAYGYPALVLKIMVSLLCGIWLVMNHVDSRAEDFPIIRPKYKLLMLLSGLLALETGLLAGYFGNLQPNVITSCCGTLFSEDVPSVAGLIAAMPPYPAKLIFFLVLVLTFRSGIQYVITGGPARVFAFFSNLLFVISVVALIAFISLYFYEMPTHHCPFCLLQEEYGYIGYPLYLSLLAAGVSGGSVGVIDSFKHRTSLTLRVPQLQRRLCLFCMIAYATFTAIAVYPMIFSDFKLEGY